MAGLEMQQDVLDEHRQRHDMQKFIGPTEVEQYFVREEDDQPDKIRQTFGFGDTCPLPMWDGQHECKAFRMKASKCSSVMCETFARNYLAKHAFDSGNHPDTQCKLKESFEAANAAILVVGVEEFKDRQNYRRMQPITPERSPSNQRRKKKRSRSPKARAEQPRQRREPPERQPAHQSIRPTARAKSGTLLELPIVPPSPTIPNPASGSVALRDVIQGEGSIRVRLADLEMLHANVARCYESQTRMIAAMTYFQRQFEDEKRITGDAEMAINRILVKARLEQGASDR